MYAGSTKDLDINNEVYDENRDFIIGLLFTETAPSVVSLFSLAKKAIPKVQAAKTPSEKKLEFIKALRTRSLLSLTVVSGKPTIANAGKPLAI